MTKDELADALCERLRKFNGLPFHENEDEIRQVVVDFIAEQGLVARRLLVTLAPDGYLEIDADDYVRIGELN